MAMNRHVHRRQGIAVICTSAWCAPSRWREILCRALLMVAPFGAVAASVALGPRWFGIALALLAVAACLACGTRTLGARLERGGGDVRAPSREGVTSPRRGSAA
jgi:hypothetical protein